MGKQRWLRREELGRLERELEAASGATRASPTQQQQRCQGDSAPRTIICYCAWAPPRLSSAGSGAGGMAPLRLFLKL